MESGLTAQNFKCRFMKVNVTKYDEVEKAMVEVASLFGKVNILVNNAGILRDGTLIKMTHENWQRG